MVYQPRRVPRHERLTLRGLDHHITCWGPPSDNPWLMLHGWADTSDTFQFVVDAFGRERSIIAPDWRGFGRSQWQGGPYWFADYVADLDALLDHLSPSGPVALVGHSMGGNVACLYAGIRPERVGCVVNLEGLGMRRTRPAEAPARYRRWLDELRAPPTFARYESLAHFADVLRRRNPRLTEARAAFIAASWSQALPEGGYTACSDPAHKLINPMLYRREEAEACWAATTAPVLMVLGGLSELVGQLGEDASEAYLRAHHPRLRLASVPAAGHMLHHDEPEAVAALIEDFLDGTAA